MDFNAAALVFGRDFGVYMADWAVSNALPADTVDYNTPWGAPWANVGATDGGLNFGIEITRGEIRIDQSLDPVFRPATGRNMTLTTNMAEFTAANIQDAAGQGTITSGAPGAGTRGFNQLDLDPTISDNYKSVAYEIKHPGDGLPFRIAGWKTLPSGGISGTISAEDNAVIQLAVQCLPDTDATPDRVLTLRDVIAATS